VNLLNGQIIAHLFLGVFELFFALSIMMFRSFDWKFSIETLLEQLCSQFVYAKCCCNA